jgi:hypothetical protein
MVYRQSMLLATAPFSSFFIASPWTILPWMILSASSNLTGVIPWAVFPITIGSVIVWLIVLVFPWLIVLVFPWLIPLTPYELN